MILAWSTNAWEDYLYWQSTDKKKLKRINQLIKDINRNHFDGLGDPEPLKHNWSDYWSRRIDREHRIVYKVDANTIFIAQCRFHY
ncbi:Txe/YoeB family addiction module toxin [Francisella noatunensis]|uniref:Putative mRNA interferase YoeB n=1 Tax=Francisella noatunensis TaxID=657445 RepID=A0A9Q2QJC0_9GAMM|nr:Txe/YoeB family addiction module toxin [Francisella noatunensis]MBK2029267.1 Txe/YoeB family addiction module toxin [Francisella noatunensis]MBK2034344.1 Txe/YoeB family addiction module toxin [Francisella noatunensis]MBK2050175.1 Txe/YoeB family addiction module toxin [Francisella noatunensis]MBK2051545.1 Txe/YoeB family addiction module toxin [Francisella noatunensis]MBK2053347.1 Txe/YoeB family addiction module toxin [Francisella noatunensis]